jgi:LacI family transcriptional regulator
MTNILEVAKQAGVSPTTVSHVINNTRFVAESTRQRVLAAMDQLGYQPNALARSLRRGETKTLGLILPDSANPFFAEIGQEIENAAFQNGYSVILCNTEGEAEKESVYTNVLSTKQVDGMIFVAAGEKSDSISTLLRQKLPLVLVDRDLGDVQVDAVLTDNFQGGQLAARHLIELDHRRVACVTGPSNLTPSAQRAIGFCSAMADAGLPLDPSFILRGDFTAESGYQAALAVLSRADRPTALFACNDMMALGVLRAASELGLSVPRDLSIVGYDDIKLCAYLIPPLTSVAQPKAQIGQIAIEMVTGRINDKNNSTRRIVLSTRLVVRQSTGRCP